MHQFYSFPRQPRSSPKATIYFLIIGLALCNAPLSAQNLVSKITDFFEFELRKPRAGEADTAFIPKLVLAPVITYEPATSLGIGIGAKLLFRPKGAGPETRTSNVPIGLSYTLKGQIIFASGYTIFFPQERWLLRGNLDYRNFPVRYYEAGPLTGSKDYADVQYQQVLVEPLLLRRIADTKFYAGGGFRYNKYFDLQETELEGEPAQTPFPAETLASTSTGVEFALTLDDRDNVLNAYKGRLMEVTHGVYGEALGGSHQFMLSKVDYRGYFQPFQGRRDVVAYQVYGRYAWAGSPELEFSALGGAERLRGFREFRWRDRLAYTAQVEYRWQTWDNFGFVFFTGVGDVTGPDSQATSFSTLKYSVGTGVRIQIVESERLNIRIDYAHGLGNSRDSGFYLGIAEAF